MSDPTDALGCRPLHNPPSTCTLQGGSQTSRTWVCLDTYRELLKDAVDKASDPRAAAISAKGRKASALAAAWAPGCGLCGHVFQVQQVSGESLLSGCFRRWVCHPLANAPSPYQAGLSACQRVSACVIARQRVSWRSVLQCASVCVSAHHRTSTRVTAHHRASVISARLRHRVSACVSARHVSSARVRVRYRVLVSY